MDKKMRIILKLLGLLILCAFMSGCRMLPIFQRTPVPLETVTPQLSLNQVTDIPTLPPVTATPTLSMGEAVNYVAPGDIFTQVTAHQPYRSQIITCYVHDHFFRVGNIFLTGIPGTDVISQHVF